MASATLAVKDRRVRYVFSAEFHTTDEQLAQLGLSLRKSHYTSPQSNPWDSLYQDGQCQFARRSIDGGANLRFHITPEERYAVRGVFPTLDAREGVAAMISSQLDLIKFDEEVE